MKGTILLTDAVKQILLNTRTPESEYFRFLSKAAQAFTKIRLHVQAFPKEIKVEMSEQGVICWPEDMLDFISIGIASYGKLWVFGRREDMITVMDEDGYPEEEIADPTPVNKVAIRGGKNTHYIKVDYDNRRIYVMGFPPQDYVYLRYTSTGISTDYPTYIPLETVPCVEAYIMWDESKYNPEIPANQKDRLEYYFHQERSLLRSLREPSITEWSDAILRTHTRRIRR